MAQWGNPFGGLRSAETIQRGNATIARAKGLKNLPPRDAALVDAVAILFSDAKPVTQHDRIVRYERAMAAISNRFADDVEIKIFYALAVSQSALPSDKTFAKNREAADILEPLFEKLPDHPGLAHYIIHAYDVPPLAPRALAAARRYASLAPAVPHALHMPSHTFTRMGLWKESIETNRKSAEAAQRAGEPEAELHALDYQTYAYLQLAQDRAAAIAVERAANLREASNGGAGSFASLSIPARFALERGDWAEAAALPVREGSSPWTTAITHFARAVGAARSGNPSAAASDIQMLAALREKLREMKDEYWTQVVDIQVQAASAWKLFAEGNQDAALTQMKAAALIEDGTDKAAVTPGPLAPARELLGYMLLEANRPAEAYGEFLATVKKEPNRFRSLYGAALAAKLAGRREDAEKQFRALLEIAKEADTERAELAEAQAFIARN